MTTRIKPSYPRLRRDHPLAHGLIYGLPIVEDNLQAGDIIHDFSGNKAHASVTTASAQDSFTAPSTLGPALFGACVGPTDINGFRVFATAENPYTVCCRVLVKSFTGNIFGHALNTTNSMLRVSVSLGVLRVWVRQSGSATTLSNALALNDWFHCAIVWDGSLAYSVISGVRQPQTMAAGTSEIPSSARINFGARFSSSTNVASLPLDGILDDCRIYNRALSDEELREIWEDPWGVYRTSNRKYWLFGVGQEGLQLNYDADSLSLDDYDDVAVFTDSSPNQFDVPIVRGLGVTKYHANAMPTGKGAVWINDSRGEVLPVGSHDLIREIKGATFVAVMASSGTRDAKRYMAFGSDADADQTRLSYSERFGPLGTTLEIEPIDDQGSSVYSAFDTFSREWPIVSAFKFDLEAEEFELWVQRQKVLTGATDEHVNAFDDVPAEVAVLWGRNADSDETAFRGYHAQQIFFGRPLYAEELAYLQDWMFRKWIETPQDLEAAPVIGAVDEIEQAFQQQHLHQADPAIAWTWPISQPFGQIHLFEPDDVVAVVDTITATITGTPRPGPGAVILIPISGSILPFAQGP